MPAVDLTHEAYGYVNGNPLNATDPTGLCSWYDTFCLAATHWRGILQTTAIAAGTVAAGACVAATAGICGGVIATGVAVFGVGAGTCAVVYALDDTCHTAAGYLTSAAIGGVTGLIGEGIGLGVTRAVSGLLAGSRATASAAAAARFSVAADGTVTDLRTLDWSLVTGNGETRLAHVRRHGADLPNRRVHGIFDGDPESLTNEAWSIAQRRGIRPTREGDVDVYRVPMGRSVGHAGGQAGPELADVPHDTVLIVVKDGNLLITAYPVPLGG